jgi:hypothetical protein
MAAALETGASAECFEELAQGTCRGLYERFEESIVLARCYVTAPFSALPQRNATWVRDLAEAKGVAAELHDRTPVISLVGTAGRSPAWNSRFDSQGHVGIPMVSASFIDAIPMMSRLMASLGGNLSWIDSRDVSHVVARLGSISGLFYVAQAAADLDGRGRHIIPAADFVSQYGVQTVFGSGGAFNSDRSSSSWSSAPRASRCPSRASSSARCSRSRPRRRLCSSASSWTASKSTLPAASGA